MKLKQKTIILLFLGVINCERVVRKQSSDIFSLEEDDLIITTPDVSTMQQEDSGDIFKYDESTPYKKGVFFMQDDFFVEAHDHAEPPMNPYQEPIK